MLVSINGAWFAPIEKTNKFDKDMAKDSEYVNVRLMYDDLVNNAQFSVCFFTKDMELVSEYFVDLRGDDYSSWDMQAESGYIFVQKKLGFTFKVE